MSQTVSSSPRNTRWDQKAELCATPERAPGEGRIGATSLQVRDERCCWIIRAHYGVINTRAALRAAGSRVTPTCALVDVRVREKETHALLALSGCCLFFFAVNICPHSLARAVCVCASRAHTHARTGISTTPPSLPGLNLEGVHYLTPPPQT